MPPQVGSWMCALCTNVNVSSSTDGQRVCKNETQLQHKMEPAVSRLTALPASQPERPAHGRMEAVSTSCPGSCLPSCASDMIWSQTVRVNLSSRGSMRSSLTQQFISSNGPGQGGRASCHLPHASDFAGVCEGEEETSAARTGQVYLLVTGRQGLLPLQAAAIQVLFGYGGGL